MVAEFRWRVPQDIHAAIVCLIDERGRQQTFGPRRRISEIIPDRFQKDMPADLRQSLNRLDDQIDQSRGLRRRIIRLLTPLVVLACVAIAAIRKHSQRGAVSIGDCLIVIGGFVIVGVALLAGARLQVWAEVRDRRRKPAKIRIRADRIVSERGYELFMNKIINLAPTQFWPKSKLTKCTFHRVEAGGLVFNAMIIKSKGSADRLIPIDPAESLDELKRVMKQWGYFVSDGDSIVLS